MKRGDNISGQRGRLNTATENKTQFGEKKGAERPGRRKREDNLRPNEGKIAWETAQGEDYKEKPVQPRAGQACAIF